MKDTEHNQIMLKLGQLDGKIDGILRRLDIANGRTEKLEGRVITLEISDGTQNVKLGMWATILGSVGGFLLSIIFRK
jgi:hypothetical protein